LQRVELALSFAVALALRVRFVLAHSAGFLLLIAFTILAGLVGLARIVLPALTHALSGALTGLSMFAGITLSWILLALILALLAIHVGALITLIRILLLLTARCFS